MKIAILGIALNEEDFVLRWLETAKDADEIILVDTGSTDNTVPIAEQLATVHRIKIDPWRFDVARNTALALVPSDIDVVVNLDLDEILLPGWRSEVEKCFSTVAVTRLHYDYIWSFDANGQPGKRFYRDMIHRRFGYMWKHPCHETLYYVGPGTEIIETTDDLHVEHHSDHTKSRKQYLNLLDLAVKEDPTNDRMSHYYGRELFFSGKIDAATKEFNRHINLPTAQWNSERAESMIYISKCYAFQNDMAGAKKYALQSVIEDSSRREPYMQCADLYYKTRCWVDCLFNVQKALEITAATKNYINDPLSFSSYLYDIGFIAAYSLKQYDLASQYINSALALEPTNERFINNKKFLETHVNKN